MDAIFDALPPWLVVAGLLAVWALTIWLSVRAALQMVLLGEMAEFGLGPIELLSGLLALAIPLVAWIIAIGATGSALGFWR
jgi:hypothetical protein